MKTRSLLILLLAAAAAGCGERPDDQTTGSIRAEDIERAREQLAPEVRTQLDSGNVAYREGRYDEARTRYQEAARLDPRAAAPWFGIYMVESATGNAEAAETAIRRARDAAPRASLIEEEARP